MRRKSVEEKNPLELVEEAFHLLRQAPAAGLVSYYLGSLPFLLGLLYFWSDMARSAFAEERLVPGTLALSLLFIWMKAWQSVFAGQLLAHLCGEPPPRWTLPWLGQAALFQAIVQPLGLFLLPVSFLLMLPFGWVYAFYSSATVFSGGHPPDVRTLFLRSWRQAALWPMQNHYLLFLLALFGLFVFLNLYSAVFGVPLLLDQLLGIETVFTRSPWAALNSTVTAAVAGLSYLCLDPMVKAVYVLRCFYGESLRTGQDLKAELRSLAPAIHPGALILLLLLMAGGAPRTCDAQNPDRGPGSVSPSELNRTIDQIIQKREYSWRLPRESAPAKLGENANLTAIERLRNGIEQVLKTMGRWMASLINWLRGLGSSGAPPPATGWGIASAMEGLLLLLIILLVGLLAWLIFHLWTDRTEVETVQVEALAPALDVADDDLGADQLPEDGWLQLGRELIGRGELRLALRAFYLATLAHLAARNLIALARFKSNQDYQRELQRRGHALAPVLDLFARNLSAFERVWYGLHEVTGGALAEFVNNVDRITTQTISGEPRRMTNEPMTNDP